MCCDLTKIVQIQKDDFMYWDHEFEMLPFVRGLYVRIAYIGNHRFFSVSYPLGATFSRVAAYFCKFLHTSASFCILLQVSASFTRYAV